MVRSAPGRNECAAFARLLLAFGGAGQHDVTGPQFALGQAEEQPPGADLDVVGCAPIASTDSGSPDDALMGSGNMMACRYAVAAVAGRPGKDPAFLAAPERSGSHTIHGHCPRWYISSSWARSLTVSAGDQ